MNDLTQSRYRHLNFKSNNVYRRFVQVDKNLEKANLKTIVLDTPAHGTYGALLFRSEWKIKREEILRRDSKSCVICNSADSLQIHHRQYHFVVARNEFKLPWEYSDNLLITLCESCHRRGHSKYKVPIINF